MSASPPGATPIVIPEAPPRNMRLGIARRLTIHACMTNTPSILLVCAVVFTVFLAIGLVRTEATPS